MFKAAMFAVSIAGMGLTGAVALGEGDSFVPSRDLDQPPAMGWHLVSEGERAKLAYGVANSDQIALMMSCAPGAAVVDIFGVVQPDTLRLTLASNTGSAVLDGAPEVDPLTGAMAVETQASLSDPVLTSFRDGAPLTVVGRGDRRELRATAEERRRIADFFSHCDRAQT